MVWGTPTRFSFYAISYNSDHMSFEESGDWNSLFLPKFEGKVGIFDWYLPNMGNASLAVHPNKENPYDLTDDQLGAVRDWLLRLRPQVSMFGSGAPAIVQAMVNGDVVGRHGRRPRYRSEARRPHEHGIDDSRAGRHPLAGGGDACASRARTRSSRWSGSST